MNSIITPDSPFPLQLPNNDAPNLWDIIIRW